EGSRTVLVGPNGTGKTTLLRIVAGELAPATGTVAGSGGMAVMAQQVGVGLAEVRDLLLTTAPAPVRAAAGAVDAAELAMMETDDEPTQLRYAQALVDWGDAGGYDAEVGWDVVCQAALGRPYE